MASQKDTISRADARNITIQLMRQGVKAGVLPEALEDFVRLGYDALGDASDTYRVQEWVTSEKVKAPHLFAAPEPQPQTGTPPAPRPQTQQRDYAAIPNPTDRLTAFRDDQQKAQREGQRS